MLFEKLLGTPKKKNLNLAAIISYIPFLFITLFFAFNEYQLISSSGYGVFDFELAWTSGTIHEIFTTWGPAEMHYQAFVTYVDYLYIACYAIFGALLILIVTRKLEGRLKELGLLMILAPLLAGIFDVVENVHLLAMLNRGVDVEWYYPFTASLCASFKTAFLLAGLGFVYIAVLLLIGKRLKITRAFLYPLLAGTGILVAGLFTLWNVLAVFLFGVVYFVLLLLVIWMENKESTGGTDHPHAA